MPRRGGVTILRVLPGFAAVREAAARFAHAKGTFFTSSNASTIAQLRDHIEANDNLRKHYETGCIRIDLLGSLVRIFADCANLPLAAPAASDYQEGLAGLAAEKMSNDSPFFECRELPGFHAALVDTLQELRKHDIDLSRAVSPPRKLADIRDLAESFEDALATHRLTTLSHRLKRLLDASPSAPQELKVVVWLSETEWPPLWLQFGDWLRLAGVELVFFTERHLTDASFFLGATQLAAACPDARIENVQCPATACASLFSGGGAPARSSDGVTVLEAADEHLETEWALRTVHSHLLRGEAEGRVCIFSRHLEKYGPLLEAASFRFGVPLKMSRNEPLLANPFASYCLATLKALASGSIQDLASAISSPYADIDRAHWKLAREQISSCERTQGDPWTELGRLARDPNRVVPTWLDFCVSWRDEAIRAARTLADWIRRFNLLMAGTPWLDACSGGGLVAKRDASAQHAMVRSLLVSQLLGDSTRNLALGEFVAHCEKRWQGNSYTIRSQTGVRVSTTPAGIGDANIVIALGMLEGRFPSRRAEDPILLDRDREWLRQARMDWRLPSSYEKAEEARREFYRVACAAPQIVFSYPLNFGETPEIRTSYLDDLEADGIMPSYTAKRYEDRFPKPHASLVMADLLGAQAWHDDKTFDPGELVANRQDQLRQAACSAKDALIANPEIKRELSALPRPLRLAHLRSLRQCPFQYVARAKLNLHSARPRWAWDCVANAVRKADLNADSADALMSNLMATLESELWYWRGKAPQHELELVRVAAPKALRAFANREIAMRQKWGLRIKGQNVSLGEACLRSTVPLGEYSLNFLNESTSCMNVKERPTSRSSGWVERDCPDRQGIRSSTWRRAS
ncbi:MAG: hypothetical protein ACR2HJ_07090 [Fimbriimonadales bacterium]